MKVLRRGAAVLLCGALVSACSSTQTSHKAGESKSSASATISLAVGPGATSLPAVIAAKEGFFAKQGIHVSKISNLADVTLIPGLVANGQYTIGEVTPPDMLTSTTHGLSAVIVANDFIDTATDNLETIIVPKNSPVRNVAQLAGLTVGTPTITGNLTLALQYDMKLHGANPNSLHLLTVALPNLSAELHSGRVQAVISIQPFTDLLLSSGDRSLGDPNRVIGSGVSGFFWMAGSKWADSHKKTISGFTSALRMARTFIADHPKTAAKTLATFTGTPLSIAEHTQLPDYRFTPTTQEIRQWQHVFSVLGLATPAITALNPVKEIVK